MINAKFSRQLSPFDNRLAGTLLGRPCPFFARSLTSWSSGPWLESAVCVDNAVVPPMSGTGFPFSPAAYLLFHVCNHFRFPFFLVFRVGVGGCGNLSASCLVSSIAPFCDARMAVGIFPMGRAFLALSPNPRRVETLFRYL